MMFDYHISIRIFFSWVAYVWNKKSYKHRTPYGGTLNYLKATLYIHICLYA